MNKDYIFMQQKEGIHLIPNAFVIASVYADGMKKATKESFGCTLVQYKEGVMYWYASQKNINKLAGESLQILQTNNNFLSIVRENYKIKMEKLERMVKRVAKANLSDMDNKMLWKKFAQYMTLYHDAYIWSEPVVLALSESLADYLHKYLQEKIVDKKELAEVYSVLSAPQEKSFVKEEEEDFLQLALGIKNKKIKNIKKALADHTKKYFWIPYDYGLEVWHEDYFSLLLQTLLKQPNLKERLQASHKYFKNLKIRQKELEKKYKIEKKYSSLFQAIREATFLQDYKKEKFTLIHFFITPLLEEMARRLKIERELAQYCLPAELEKALVENILPDKKELIKRRQNSLFIFDSNKVDYLLGAKAWNFLQNHRKSDKTKQTTLIGVTASTGLYTGKVKIVSEADDIKKVKTGEVLVATMTSPDYVPAMRLAGAVVTDQGGIMCHAAILSRELGIPCVVGTKSATQTFKNGEQVEVNADLGIIKKV